MGDCADGPKVDACEAGQIIKEEILKREVVETHTPGTITETLDGEDAVNRYIIALFYKKNRLALACSDICRNRSSLSRNLLVCPLIKNSKFSFLKRSKSSTSFIRKATFI